jgi:hypothetical protein
MTETKLCAAFSSTVLQFYEHAIHAHLFEFCGYGLRPLHGKSIVGSTSLISSFNTLSQRV